MKGTWKENLGGWNHKDSKRKKQTRKHLLRDNGRYYSMHDEDCKSCRIESEVEVNAIYETKHGETKNIYKIKINKWFDSYSTRVAYVYGDPFGLYGHYARWYDAYTEAYIDEHSKRIEVLGLAWQEYTHYDEPRTITKGYSYSGRGWSDELLFVHNKPYYQWERYNRFRDYPRKWAQKEVNRSNRAKVKQYIKNGDWDKEIKLHSCTKSIAWMIS
jgi:hypothetical protein